MIIVSDTSPISNLILIDKLWILKELYKELIIPDAVYEEISKLREFNVDLKNFEKEDWIIRKKPNDKQLISHLLQEIDLGESEAIALAIEIEADYLLIDERLGTFQARKRNLKTIGLIGSLLKAKQMNIISEIKPILTDLDEKAGFWMSEKFRKRILREAKEI